MTTDLLSVWTDPDTAMHAVGASLGIFDGSVAGTVVVLPDDSPLRNALFDVLLTLVDDGELEKRACSDGRYVFRWREDFASSAVSTDATSARLDAWLESMPRALPSRVPIPVPTPVTAPAPIPIPVVTPKPEPVPIRIPEPAVDVVSPGAPSRQWFRLVATTAPLLLPSLSCLLAVTAFVVLGTAVGLVVLGALALVGAVGLVRRVPLAGFWTGGLVVAGLLMRFS